VRLIGLDPGLQRTGWGVIDADAGRLTHVAHGVVGSTPGQPLSERLKGLFLSLQDVLTQWRPEEAAVEEVFVNKNPESTLKLGQARAMALLAPAMIDLPVAEYPTNLIKKTVVGSGHAQKRQIAMMVGVLLPTAGKMQEDAADALAVAICHAHHREASARLLQTVAGSGR
jgi:crossover junction endodeoxyribonuclease RuvC